MASAENRQFVRIGKCISFCFKLISDGIELNPNNYEFYRQQKKSTIPRWNVIFSSFDDLLFVVDKAISRSIEGSYKGFWNEDKPSVLSKCKEYNHKILAIKRVQVSNIPVYCLSVPNCENFVLSAGVVVHNCPSQLYHGYSYMGDQLGYLYGLPREGRFPKIQNPNLQLATCKHVHIALQHILNNKEKIIKMFGVYYKRLDETPLDTMIAVPAKAVEEKEETLEDFMGGFDEDGNEIPKVEGIGEDFEDTEVEVEEISVQDPDTGVVKIDSKLAEKSLPSEQQVTYAGEEDEEHVNEDTLASVADSISEEEEEDLAQQIDEVSLDGVLEGDGVGFPNE